MIIVPWYWEFISLMFIIYAGAPWLLALIYRESIFFWFAIGVFAIELIIKISRIIPYSPQYHSIVMRPPGATNCSCFNTGGLYKGRIGMPSGHVMITTYFVCGLYHILNTKGVFDTNVNYKYLYICASLILIILMALSRLKKQCHNLWQVVIGCVLGVVFAEMWFQVYKKYFNTPV